jgi:hypothetical protein
MDERRIAPRVGLTSCERIFAQGLFFDALNNAYFGSPSVLVVVDRAAALPASRRGAGPHALVHGVWPSWIASGAIATACDPLGISA